jgi:hypothetical protein
MNSAARRCVFRMLVLGGGLLSAPADARAQSASAEPMKVFIGGFHYGVPLKWSALLAASYPVGSDESRAFVGAEPGIGGWRASVGYVRMCWGVKHQH